MKRALYQKYIYHLSLLDPIPIDTVNRHKKREEKEEIKEQEKTGRIGQSQNKNIQQQQKKQWMKVWRVEYSH